MRLEILRALSSTPLSSYERFGAQRSASRCASERYGAFWSTPQTTSERFGARLGALRSTSEHFEARCSTLRSTFECVSERFGAPKIAPRALWSALEYALSEFCGQPTSVSMATKQRTGLPRLRRIKLHAPRSRHARYPPTESDCTMRSRHPQPVTYSNSLRPTEPEGALLYMPKPAASGSTNISTK